MKRANTWGVCIAAFLLASCGSNRRSSIDDLQIGMPIDQVHDLVTMQLRQASFDEAGNEYHMFLLSRNQRQAQLEAETYTYICFTNGKYDRLMTSPERL